MIPGAVSATYVVGLLGAIAGFWTGGEVWSVLDVGGRRATSRTFDGAGGIGGSAEQSQFGLGDDNGDGCGRGAFMPVSVSCQCPSVECTCPQVEVSCSCGDVPADTYNMSVVFRWSELFREPAFTFSWLSWGAMCGLLARCIPSVFQRKATPLPAILERDICRYATEVPSPDRGRTTPVRPVRRTGHVA